ncbi:MAG TPA: glycosyltransferase [Anaerolineae bacterium]|nr:glycosyltransferase [Anaerolineae bacterium]
MNPEGLPSKRTSMYCAIVGVWAIASTLLWLDVTPSLRITVSASDQLAIGLMALGLDLGWLYGFYHLGLVVFTRLRPQAAVRHSRIPSHKAASHPIAVFHTVCDDFQPDAALSCVSQEYPEFHVYLLDDSSTEDSKRRVDDFGRKFEKLVTIIRRTNRIGFKAGNLNNALSKIPGGYKYIALADSDTFLPSGFLRATSRLLDSNAPTGFVQAVHVANLSSGREFAHDLEEIVRIGWTYYQLIRNEYGFPMCYGHGALIRFEALSVASGFPEIVSEDIALTLKLRKLGIRGIFTSDVICGEDYPSDYHSFRKRLSRWVSADMECFRKELLPFLFVKKVDLVEKLDAVIRGLKVPLASMFLPLAVTIDLVLFRHPGVEDRMSARILFISLVTCLAPYFCFVFDMVSRPKRLFFTVSHLTAVYCSCALLYIVRVVEALLLRRSYFYVTGAKYTRTSGKRRLTMNEAGYPLLGIAEIALSLPLIAIGIYTANLVLIGLSASLVLAPMVYAFGWKSRWTSSLIHVPLIFMLMGILLSCFYGIGSKAQWLVLAGLSILLF